MSVNVARVTVTPRVAAHSSSFELLKQPIESQEKAVGDCSASHAAGRFLIRQDETKQN